jgi:hypothetical protein
MHHITRPGPRPLRFLALIVTATTAGLALWAAVLPPATSTVTPGAPVGTPAALP